MRYRALAVWIAAIGSIAGCAAHPPKGMFAPRPPDELADPDRPIAVVGDLQMTSRFVRAVMRRESNEREQAFLLADLQQRADSVAALVVAGDLVFTARSRSDWRRFDRLVGPIARSAPVLPAIGNHDYHCFFVQKCLHTVVPRNFLYRFPWFSPGQPYSVGYGDIILVFLDSETRIDLQGRWLAERLPEWESAYRAALIFVHRPPFTDSAVHGALPDTSVQQHVVARLSTTRLPTVVIAGHVHGYEHLVVDGKHYVVTGGGGGPRGVLRADRPNDVYAGPDCLRDELGQVQRPFNYLLIDRRAVAIDIAVHGFCRGDAAIRVLESFSVALPVR